MIYEYHLSKEDTDRILREIISKWFNDRCSFSHNPQRIDATWADMDELLSEITNELNKYQETIRISSEKGCEWLQPHNLCGYSGLGWVPK